MQTHDITMLTEVGCVSGGENIDENTALETHENSDMFFSGLFIGYGALDAQIYAKQNNYNIFEDEKYQHDIIIEFDNHYIKQKPVFQSPKKMQFDTAKQVIEHLQSLEILPIDNAENRYKKFVEEIDIEILENLSYPVAIVTADDRETLGAPRDCRYVTLMIATNNFPDSEQKSLELQNSMLMSIPFSKKTTKMCFDYDFYKNAYLYDIYVYQEHPETKQKKLVHVGKNKKFPFTDELFFHSTEIALYIEDNVLGVDRSGEKPYEPRLQLCESHKLSKNFLQKSASP